MIPATVAEAARRFGDRTAYVTEAGWSLTYGDVDRVSDEVAAGLVRRGVSEGDVVALILPPGPEYLLAYCGAAKVGAITAGVNDRLSARERAAVLDVAQPKLVLTLAGSDAAAPGGEVVEIARGTGVDDVLREVREPGGCASDSDSARSEPQSGSRSIRSGLPKRPCCDAWARPSIRTWTR